MGASSDYIFYKDNILQYIATQTVPDTLEEKNYIKFIGYDSLEASYQVITLTHLLKKLQEQEKYIKLDLNKIVIKNVTDKIYLLIVDDPEQKNLITKAIKDGDLKRILYSELLNIKFTISYRGFVRKVTRELEKVIPEYLNISYNSRKTIQRILSETAIKIVIDFWKEFLNAHPELQDPNTAFLFAPDVLSDNGDLTDDDFSKISNMIDIATKNTSVDIVNTSALKPHSITLVTKNEVKENPHTLEEAKNIMNTLTTKHYEKVHEQIEHILKREYEHITKKNTQALDKKKIVQHLTENLNNLMLNKKVEIPFIIKRDKNNTLFNLYEYVNGLKDDVNIKGTKGVYRIYIRHLGKPYKYVPENGKYPKSSTNKKYPEYITDAYLLTLISTNISKPFSNTQSIITAPLFTFATLEEVKAITEKPEQGEFEQELLKHLFNTDNEIYLHPESILQAIITQTILTIMNTARVYSYREITSEGVRESIGGVAVLFDDNGNNKMLKFASDITVNLPELKKVTPEIEELITRSKNNTIGLFKMYLRIMSSRDNRLKNLKQEVSELMYIYFITGNEKYLTKIPVAILQTIKRLSKEEQRNYKWLINTFITMTKTMNKFLQTH